MDREISNLYIPPIDKSSHFRCEVTGSNPVGGTLWRNPPS